MARPRKYKKDVYFGGRVDARVRTAFQMLCDELGISAVKAFERLMVDAINSKEIPGITRLDAWDEPSAPLPDRRQREKELDERISSEENTFAEGSILHDSSNRE
jgi:antitoxin component of RelBE/YafQ-DinJ toxin-antitoxin module